ncbi:hypothetical protein CTA1_4640 [Colletotrichum tanaceti]|uniref:Uncharacterized protein n=1 Tax=Colletotrichum tanaceti TaxID=1306861 RepID=A0A4U6X4R5_9PEZI|nr:hypothetical protein CTA1_4640 [Colletotrichum tanaceti]
MGRQPVSLITTRHHLWHVGCSWSPFSAMASEPGGVSLSETQPSRGLDDILHYSDLGHQTLENRKLFTFSFLGDASGSSSLHLAAPTSEPRPTPTISTLRFRPGKHDSST